MEFLKRFAVWITGRQTEIPPAEPLDPYSKDEASIPVRHHDIVSILEACQFKYHSYSRRKPCQACDANECWKVIGKEI